jgi:hypothetical protein
MGSGSRFQIDFMHGQVGLGLFISRFPHQLSIDIGLICFRIYIGFGKGYDE